MALPDYLRDQIDAEITWRSAGGSGAITLAGLTNGSYRQGAKADLGANHAPLFWVILEIELAATPTAGNEISIWFSTSNSATAGTDNLGGTNGTDAAYSGYASNAADVVKQLIFAGSLSLGANAQPVVQKGVVGVVSLPQRYAAPVLLNGGGSSVHTSDANCVIRLVPIAQAILE